MCAKRLTAYLGESYNVDRATSFPRKNQRNKKARVLEMEIQRYQADVLIVGGGLAGLNAAIGAAENGARVAVMDKATVERSGDIAGGVDHFLAFLEEGEEWDTREAFLEYVGRVAKGAVNLEVQDAVFCREVRPAIERMARIGNPLTQADGSFYRTQSMGAPGPYWINFNGKHLKPKLGKEVRRLGCRVLDRVPVTSLLVSDGQVVGAAGFHIRKGTFVVVESKATVLSTGNTNRLFETPTGMPFNTWLCPADTGTAPAVAFKAGAALANMEYVRMTVVPKGFSSPGLNAFTGMGCHFVNAAGEEFMSRYHPLGNKAPRYKLAEGVMSEIRAGRGPVYLDCRHLSEGELTHLKKTLGYDKETLPDFIKQRGVDLVDGLLEIMVSEGMQAGPGEVCGSGVMIDERCAASVPGLYAAGDCADQTRCVHASITGGYVAGREAARYARSLSAAPVASENVIAAERERVFAPLNRKDGVSHREFEDIIRRITTEHIGAVRTELGLEIGLSKLGKLDGIVDRLSAENLHELMRIHEAQELLAVGKIMAHAARYRKETRFGVFHNRVDHPRTDDENWLGQVVVRQENGQINTSFRPLSYEIPPRQA
ncbi:MAG: FAD-binding protein [Chloroflexi bacterium]|nr:FAD-binding protein [Chloroflexota bacterium]